MRQVSHPAGMPAEGAHVKHKHSTDEGLLGVWGHQKKAQERAILKSLSLVNNLSRSLLIKILKAVLVFIQISLTHIRTISAV